MIGKKTGFNRIMGKIKTAQEKTLKVKKKIKIGRRGEIKILIAGSPGQVHGAHG